MIQIHLLFIIILHKSLCLFLTFLLSIYFTCSSSCILTFCVYFSYFSRFSLFRFFFNFAFITTYICSSIIVCSIHLPHTSHLYMVMCILYIYMCIIYNMSNNLIEPNANDVELDYKSLTEYVSPKYDNNVGTIKKAYRKLHTGIFKTKTSGQTADEVSFDENNLIVFNQSTKELRKEDQKLLLSEKFTPANVTETEDVLNNKFKDENKKFKDENKKFKGENKAYENININSKKNELDSDYNYYLFYEDEIRHINGYMHYKVFSYYNDYSNNPLQSITFKFIGDDNDTWDVTLMSFDELYEYLYKLKDNATLTDEDKLIMKKYSNIMSVGGKRNTIKKKGMRSSNTKRIRKPNSRKPNSRKHKKNKQSIRKK